MITEFAWLGNHPAIDLVNTEVMGEDGATVDLLSDVDALVSWAQRSGATRHAGRLDLSRHEAARTLAFVRRLRAALRHALSSGGRDAEAVLAVNEILREAPGALHIEPGSGVTSLQATAPTAQLRTDIASAAVDIFGRDLRRVRQCASPACVLMFLDVSRSGQRRWCDMATCGNRAKAAAHHARGKRSP
ncbi:MAG: CGNR zinc finger domain-containing protein [Actinomycetota bacterium]|nr:CGNR zinc finger domain-containing protein [Actinomycetota bacterium]